LGNSGPHGVEAKRSRISVFKNGNFYHYEFFLDGRRHRGSTGTASKQQAIKKERLERERLDKSYSQVLGEEARDGGRAFSSLSDRPFGGLLAAANRGLCAGVELGSGEPGIFHDLPNRAGALARDCHYRAEFNLWKEGGVHGRRFGIEWGESGVMTRALGSGFRRMPVHRLK
jgi:hypothetical protein